MAVRKKVREKTNEVPSRDIPPLPPPSSPAIPSEVRDNPSELAFLKAELETNVCSPKLEKMLKEIPERDLGEGDALLLARAAIKFGIEEDAWIRRVLETSTRKLAAVEILLEHGARGTSPVCRAILEEIISWDEDWNESSPVRIRSLIGHLDRLFKGEHSSRAAVLEQIADEEPENARLRLAVDSLLDRDTTGASAKRARWFAEAESIDTNQNESNILLNEFFQSITFPSSETKISPSGMGEGIAGRLMAEEEKDKDRGESAGHAPPERLVNLDSLLAPFPELATYEEQARRLEDLKDDINHQIASRVIAAIKEKLQLTEHDTYAKKLDATRWLNSELRRFDLAISSPAVGGAATFSAETGGREGKGRFRLKGKHKDEDGGYANFHTQDIFDLLANIQFVDAKRREALSEWRDKIKQEPGEATRS